MHFLRHCICLTWFGRRAVVVAEPTHGAGGLIIGVIIGARQLHRCNHLGTRGAGTGDDGGARDHHGSTTRFDYGTGLQGQNRLSECEGEVGG